MPNQYRMSYFMPPIAPVRNEQGRMVTPPTLLPFCEVSVEQVFQMITCNENLKLLTAQVRNAPDMRTAKATLLPYVTPCGTFTRRNSKCFVSPSGTLYPEDEAQNITESMNKAMQYVEMAYGPEPDNSGRNASKGVDCSGKDLVRACFLNYDPDALFRNIINSQSIKK